MRALVLACFFLSGASGLIFEMVWTRGLTLVFGSTTLAISTVLTAFMGGLGLGSYLAGRLADRLRDPVRAYALAELAIGLYALLVPLILAGYPALNLWLWSSFGDRYGLLSLLRFIASAGLLLLPTTLMGATLPILGRYLVSRPWELQRVGLRLGTLYAINLFGAVTGSFLAGFVLLPLLGVRTTNLIAAGVQPDPGHRRPDRPALRPRRAQAEPGRAGGRDGPRRQRARPPCRRRHTRGPPGGAGRLRPLRPVRHDPAGPVDPGARGRSGLVDLLLHPDLAGVSGRPGDRLGHLRADRRSPAPAGPGAGAVAPVNRRRRRPVLPDHRRAAVRVRLAGVLDRRQRRRHPGLPVRGGLRDRAAGDHPDGRRVPADHTGGDRRPGSRRPRSGRGLRPQHPGGHRRVVPVGLRGAAGRWACRRASTPPSW